MILQKNILIDAIKQRRYLILAIALTILVVLATAYIFASQKSEPEYLSKIDRLMFEEKNASPKFILTLPDRNKLPKTEVKKIIENGVNINNVQKQKPSKSGNIDMLKFMAKIPLLTRLSPLDNLQPLKNVELIEDLSEKFGNMILPKVSAKGKKPWIEYANTIKVAPNFYQVAIVIKNFGIDTRAMDIINSSLPSEVSFSFSPYAKNTAESIKKARLNGHETYVDLLLSSPDFLTSDSGPKAMSLTASPVENLQRLQESLNVGAPIGGVVVNAGVANVDTQDTINRVLSEIHHRGLLMIDATKAEDISSYKIAGLIHRKAEIVIDEHLSKEKIEESLREAERLALNNGQVLVVIEPKPIVVLAVNEWIKSFSKQLTYEEIKAGKKIEKPLTLVPVSMLVVE